MSNTTAWLTITRTSPEDVQQRELYASLDGKRIAIILYGDVATVAIPPGRHELRVHNTLSRKRAEFDAAPGQHVRFRAANVPGKGFAYWAFFVGGALMWTAIKVHFGRYLDGAGTSDIYLSTDPSLRMPQTTSWNGAAGVARTWIDANRKFVPDCDLMNPHAQDQRGSGGDLCGVRSDTNFGRNMLANDYAPEVLNGWGVRPSDRVHAATSTPSLDPFMRARRSWWSSRKSTGAAAEEPAGVTGGPCGAHQAGTLSSGERR